MANTTTTRTSPRSGANGSQSKSTNKSKSFGATFSPGFTVNVNAGNKTNSNNSPGGGSGGGGGRGGQFMLPDPDFRSAAELREYCNTLRAFAVHASIEVHVAAEILQAALGQANGLPQDNAIQHKLRARKVARKLKKSADALSDAASLAAATFAAFQREYADVLQARPAHRPAQARPFQY
ncbi:plasmid transfer protein TraA [Streptomyces jumonjinensis]|uniref:plasmid transfer protein TraA n=1 Tax=Streptomyces jumonjinensis TaxID=1945 RepID=UPI0037BA946C